MDGNKRVQPGGAYGVGHDLGREITLALDRRAHVGQKKPHDIGHDPAAHDLHRHALHVREHLAQDRGVVVQGPGPDPDQVFLLLPGGA